VGPLNLEGSLLGQLLDTFPAGEVYIVPRLGVAFEQPWVITKED
jgi:hypothetical protein